MRVSELYDGPFKGKEIYIVGTGPSMKVFDVEYLQDKCCILLNNASNYLPLGPIAFSNGRRHVEPLTNPRINCTIVKARSRHKPNAERDDNDVPWDDPNYYCFSYRDWPWDDVPHHDRAALWREPCHYWNAANGTVAIFAIQFALQAGASAVILVGCDCTALEGEEYLDPALTAAKNRKKTNTFHDYEAYARGLIVIKEEARRKFGVPVLTLTPFCGLGRERQQFGELSRRRMGELGSQEEKENMDKVVRVSIGSEPMQLVAMEVLKHSILRRTSRPVEFTVSWTPDGWHPLISSLKESLKQPEAFGGTQFNLWRWLVPEVYQHQGKAIYLDADQVVLADIGELWDALSADAAFGAVDNAVGIFGKKKTPEPGVWQTSVMILNCAKCDWDARALCRWCQEGALKHLHGPEPRNQYQCLMRAQWFDGTIQAIDPRWNHFGIHLPDTRLLHWSHVRSQPYRNPHHGTAQVFLDELRATVEAGHLTMELIDQEISRGYLHGVYGQALRQPRATLAELLAGWTEEQQPEEHAPDYGREIKAIRAELEAAKVKLARVKRDLKRALSLQETWTWKIGSAVTRPVRLVRRLALGRR